MKTILHIGWKKLSLMMLFGVLLLSSHSATAQQKLYAIEGNAITEINTSTGTSTVVYTFPSFVNGVTRFTYNEHDDLFYIIDDGGVNDDAILMSLDICNDSLTVIDTLEVAGTGVNFTNAEGFDYDPNTQTFYMAGSISTVFPSYFASDSLYTVDVTTAQATFVATIDQPAASEIDDEADVLEFWNVHTGTSSLAIGDGSPTGFDNDFHLFDLPYSGLNAGNAGFLGDPYVAAGNLATMGLAYNADDSLLYAFGDGGNLVTVTFLPGNTVVLDTITQLANNVIDMEWGTGTCCPYEIPGISMTCDSLDCTCCGTPTICVPFNVKDTIQGAMIGIDFCINYDEQFLTPTGNVDLGPVVLNGSTEADYAINYVMTPGQLHVSIFYTPLAPMGTNFTGLGEIACVEFQLSPSYNTGDTLDFTVCEVMEGFEVGVELECADPGYFVLQDDTTLNAKIIYWNDDNKPLKYDVQNPTTYLETWISGTDDTCAVINQNVSLPDTTGWFSYSVTNGTSIQILRDIQGNYFSTAPCPAPSGVMPTINGMDAYWMSLVTTLNGSFVPNVYQIIAMDVTMDGVVSANDITQLNRRTLGLTCEFPQDWNGYADTINGIPPTDNSLDWRFIDRTTVENDPSYTVSGTYPTNDNMGYSRYRVPNVPLCLEVPVDSNGVYCTIIPDQVYNGILLGDVNASWNSSDTIADHLKAGSEIIYALDEATKDQNCVISVPVYYNHTGNMMAIDFAMDYDDSRLTVQGAAVNNGFSNPMVMGYNDLNNDLLMLTSYSSQPGGISTTDPIYYLQFTSVNDVILSSDFVGITSYLNGMQVASSVQGSIADCQTIGTLNIEEVAQNNVDAYPNPFDDVLHVEFDMDGPVQIELLDMKGRQVLVSEHKGESSVVINTNNVPSGLYMVYVNGAVYSKVVKY